MTKGNPAVDEVKRIRAIHEQLRADFLYRDGIRHPNGWKLPPDSECGEAWFRNRDSGGAR